jgi:epidermal growth factor receptor substrate 15
MNIKISPELPLQRTANCSGSRQKLEFIKFLSFVSFCIIFLNFPIYAQTFTISGGVDNENGTREGGVVITAKGGTQQSVTTNASGRYKISLDYGKRHTIEFTKQNFVKRFFIVDLTSVREQDLSSGDDFASLDIIMISESPGVDLSALSNTPITTFTFQKKAGQLVKDDKQEAFSNKLLEEARAKKSGPDKNSDALNKENQKKLQEKIKLGDQAFAAGDFEKASKTYLEAIDFAGKNKLDESEALAKLTKSDDELNKKKLAELEERQANEAILKLIDEGKKLEIKKDFKGAKAKYEEAMAKKPGFKEAVELLEKVNKVIADQEADEKKNADYQKALADGKALFDMEKWLEAKTKYLEAKALKPTEREADAQIQIIDKKIAEQEKNTAALAKYEGIMSTALELQKAEKYDEAIAKYREAQLLFKDKNEPREGIEICEQKKKEKADLAKAKAEQEKLDKDYAAAVQKADAFFDSKRYAEAIKEYEIANKIKPGEAHPIGRITASQNAMAEIASADEKKKQFESLKKDGEKALSTNKLDEAKEKFTQANTIISGDAFVIQKLDEIEKKQQAIAAAEATENAYKTALDQGENAVKNGAYQDAKNFFEEAKKLKPNEKLPKDRIDFVDAKLKEMAADLAKKQQFDELINSANTKETKNDLNGALSDLKKANELIKDAGVQNRITTIEKSIADQAAQAQKKANYDAAIAKADAAFKNKEWENAIKLFQDAKKIDESQNYPDGQIALAQTELSKMQNAKQRKESYNKMFADGDKFFKDKKYSEAESAFENALNYADEVADKEKAQKRIAELKEIIEKQNAAAAQKKTYDEAIVAAQNFEKDNNIDAALAKYKEAANIDNTAPLPKQKITELTQKIAERDKNNAQQTKFNEIIALGDALFDAGQFTDAIIKYKETEIIIPNSPITKQRIEEVHKKIKETQQNEAEVAYQKLLTEAQNSREIRNYDNAIKLYNQAAKERPNDPLPKTKIKEINEEINRNKAEEANLQLKKERFNKLMQEGRKLQDQDQLDKALASFNEASRLMPDEAEPKHRIEQINNIRASREASELAQQNRLGEFKRLIEQGDRAFNGSNFDDALQLYRDASALDNSDEKLKLKIITTEERISTLAKNEEERVWRAKLANADKAFTDREYDLAEALYNEVLILNPGNKRASEQLALIEKIKVKSSEPAQLTDFGNPSYHSIIEGEALMAQAERQREYNRLSALRNQIIDIESKLDQEFSKEDQEIQSTYVKSVELARDKEAFTEERKDEQMRTENLVREKVTNMTEAQLIENLLAYKDIIDIQFKIRTINEDYIEGVKGNFLIPNMNDEEMKRYLLGITRNTDGLSLNHIESLLSNDQFINSLIGSKSNNTDLSRVLVNLNVAFITTLMLDLDNVSVENLESQNVYLNRVLESLNNYAEFINDETRRNNSSAVDMSKRVESIYESTRERAENNRNEQDKKMQELLERIQSVETLIIDQNNQSTENQTQFHKSVSTLQANHLDVQMALIRLNYLKTHSHDQKLKQLMLYDSEDFELWENDIKNALAELRELERQIQIANDNITADTQAKAYLNIEDINKIIAEKEAKYSDDNTRQTEIAGEVSTIERSSADSRQEQLNNVKKQINQNRAFLDQLERKEIIFNEAAANMLGEQFPEGVTEENFVIKDNEGLVIEVKTRRIVVVKGAGNVYLRHSNRYGVTYSKNGVSITEYQWIKETQNAKLPKYKVN